MDASIFRAVFESSPNSYMLLDREFRFVAANPAYVRATGMTLDTLLGRHLFDAFPHDPADPHNHNARLLRESLQRVLALRAVDVISVNGRVLEYFGVSDDRVPGSTWQRFVHPEDLDHAAARWGESLRSGREYEIEFRLRRADGAYRWHLGRAVAMHDAAGAASRWFGTNTDIDDAKRAQDELRERSWTSHRRGRPGGFRSCRERRTSARSRGRSSRRCAFFIPAGRPPSTMKVRKRERGIPTASRR